MYRVRYTGGAPWKTPSHPVVDQPQPRSAWGQAALLKAKEEMGRARWRGELNGIVSDAARPAVERLRALEAMQIHGPKPRVEELDALLDDSDPALRAQAVYLLGASEDEVDLAVIASVLKDSDPFVIRRACEALVRRIGQGPAPADAAVVETLLAHLDHADVFVRYAARLALQRIDKAGWKSAVLDADFATQPQRVLTGLLALVLEAPTCEDSQAVVAKLATLPAMDMPEALLLDYTRLIQLAVIRNACETADYAALTDVLLPALIQRFPSEDYRMNREMQVLLAHFQEAAAISPMLDHLTEDLPQEEQVHTVYCLRAIKDGWTKQQRQELIEWFDRGRTLGGGASFEGYINNLWASMLETMPGPEQEVAKLRQERALRKQREEAAALVAAAGKPDGSAGELMQMSFAELSEYLEYDPMAYREPDLKRGEAIFIKAKCAACHVFGSVGKGGGPDLSTVAARFRRGDLLDAIMYPSKVVSDQYIGVEATTKDGAKFLGILAGENDTTLTMITAYGDRVEIAKDNIAEQKPATASIMPEGLLNTLSQDELVCLVQYLEHGAQ
jgi:putative heme-binding domain-containing protein